MRDKDAVNASMLICEMARWYRQQGRTLAQAMDALYQEFGYYKNRLLSEAFEGQNGMETMRRLMDQLRKQPPKALSGLPVQQVVDYRNADVTGLPSADVLEFRLKSEYNVDIRMERLPYQYIRWVENEELDVNTLTPIEAMSVLYELVNEAKQ